MLPAAWQPGQALAEAARDWTQPATPAQLDSACLPPQTPALWHAQGGWIKPARLVAAWLSTPGITWRGNATVSQLVRHVGAWRAFDDTGHLLAEAELVVLAAGPGTRMLAESAGLENSLALQPIRGQASWALHASGDAAGQADWAKAMPPFPVNGHGSLVPAVPLAEGLAWVAGSSFERDNTSTQLRPTDERHNFSKLQTLLPAAAQALAPQFDSGQVQGWAAIRCATPSRLPSLGPLAGVPDAWVCSGMGSRGLTFAALCGELLAARLHGEPLPLEQRQADALLPQYAAR